MRYQGPPAHVIVGPAEHGVNRLARQIATAVSAPIVHATSPSALAVPCGPIQIHMTDHLWGSTALDAAAVVTDLAAKHPVALTLHDLPHPDAGETYRERADGYREMARAVATVTVNSAHEQLLLREAGIHTSVTVIGLPVEWTPPPPQPVQTSSDVTLAGFVYPGKGHLAVLEAMSALDADVGLRAVGGVSAGHDWLIDELHAAAHAMGRRFVLTGHLTESAWLSELWRARVPVVAHHHVSASGSLGSWIGAGRRPLVADSRYAREVAASSPHSLRIYRPGQLAEALSEALADPASTYCERQPALPDLQAVAEQYRRVWATL